MTLCSPWLTLSELGDCGCTTAPNPAVITDSLLAASEVLYQLSGRIYPGICEGIVRPCGDACNCFFDDCSCNRLPKAFLRYDALEVIEVDVAGVILEPDTYRLEAGFLVRLDGGAWPCCQDLGAEVGAEDTFSVTITYGAVAPSMGLFAARELTSEMVKSCTPGETCNLPKRVTNLVRQGVAMTLLDPMDFLDNGRTGLYWTDLFLSVVNPGGFRRPSSAWSPDLPKSVTFPILNVS